MALSSENFDFNRGLDLFNRAHFFDAHEALEDVWRSLPRAPSARQRLRVHVQGMVQLAVAFHHQSTGNYVGAGSVLQRAMRNLKGADRSFPHLDFDRLRVELANWQLYLQHAESAGESKLAGSDNCRRPAPPLPKIMFRR